MWGLGSLALSCDWVLMWFFCSSKLNSGISEEAQPVSLKMNSECSRRLSLHAHRQMGPQTARGQPARGRRTIGPHCSGLVAGLASKMVVVLTALFIFDLFGGRGKVFCAFSLLLGATEEIW